MESTRMYRKFGIGKSSAREERNADKLKKKNAVKLKKKCCEVQKGNAVKLEKKCCC